jgi:hypothetical protein
MPSREPDLFDRSILDGRWWLRLLWLTIPFGLGYFALPISMGWSTAEGDVVLVEDSVVNTLRWFVPASAVVLLGLGVWKPRTFPSPVMGALVLFFGCGSVFFMGARSLSDGVVASDGKTYVFFHHQIFQGRMAYLGRVKQHEWMARTVEVIDGDQGEFGFSFASLVRPVGSANNRTYVTITPEGVVIGMIGPTAFATARVGQEKSLTAAELRSLSPFVLMGDAGEGVEEDVTAIIEHLRDNLRVFERNRDSEWAHPAPNAESESSSGTPTQDSLLAALASPNPWIRAAATRIVSAGGPNTYPEATKRLASAPK